MIGQAILKIKSDAQVSIAGDNIDTCTFEWHDGNPTNITREQIKSKIQEMQYWYDRKSEYPSIVDQLDMQYWDKVNGTSTWQDAITKVKSDNPKE
jgi:hypothetical protein